MIMYETVLLIPYRNRESHLKYFVKHAIPLIEKHLKSLRISIVSQGNEKPFNRGKLLNVGLKEYENKTRYFIIHDVDIIPYEDVIKNHYVTNYDHIFRIHSSHAKSLGGIVKISCSDVYKINGFPNYLWGWGIEDRALFYRARICNIHVSKNIKISRNFTLLSHDRDDPERTYPYQDRKKEISDHEDYIFQKARKEEQMKHIMSSGLNTLEYEILERRNIGDNMEFIDVDI